MLQPWRDASSPDLNGDACVDVLDMQLLVASLLRHGTANPDVNGDGRVDVLDLQAFLSGEGRTDTPDKPTPTEHPPGVTPAPVSAPQHYPLAGLCHTESAATVREALSPFRETVPRHTANTGALRYLFGLTPHAPPVTGSMREV
jgi:hypothetical protein